MANEREVKIRITAVDGTKATVDAIGDSLKRLGAIPLTGKTGKKDAALEYALRDIRRLESERKKSHAEAERAEKILSSFRIQESKRTANELIKNIERVRKEAAKGQQAGPKGSGFNLFETIFGATTLSGVAANAATSIINGITSGVRDGLGAALSQAIDAVNTAVDFQRTEIAIAGVVGSVSEAGVAIKRLEEIAKNTPGLTFQNALEGYQRLRAVSFSAREAERALVGLSKVKILSGGTKQDLQAVLVNFAQIRSIGKLTGDELRETLGRFPYFAQVLQKAFGTISTEKIGELALSSEDFFDRILDELDKVPDAAGGAGTAFEKLQDEFYKAQIAFGEPILAPLTAELQDFAKYLDQNKGLWKEWGEYVADIIRGLPKLSGDTVPKPPPSPLTAALLGGGGLSLLNGLPTVGGKPVFTTRQLLAGATAGSSELLGSPFSLLQQRGAERNARQTALNNRYARPAVGLNGDPIATAEQRAKIEDMLADRNKKRQDDDVRLYKEKYKTLGELQERDSDALESKYSRDKAALAATLRNNLEQEVAFQRQTAAIAQKEGNERISILEKEIAGKRKLNTALVASYTNPQDRARIEKLKEFELSKDIANLDKERGKQQIEEANRQRELLELEKRLADQRRQSAIELNKLQIQRATQNSDVVSSQIERELQLQVGAYEDGYNALIKLTQGSYETISRLTREQFAKQLEDVSLTEDQKRNIRLEGALAEQSLAQANAQKILQIEDRRYQEQIQRAEAQADRLQSVLTARVGAASSAEGFFGDNFGARSIKAFQDTFLGKGLKEQLDQLKAAREQIKADLKASNVSIDGGEFQIPENLLRDPLGPEFSKINSEIDDLRTKLKRSAETFEPFYAEIEKLGLEINQTVGAFGNFDKIGEKSLFLKQSAEVEQFNIQLNLTKKLLADASDQYRAELQRKIQSGTQNAAALRQGGGTLDVLAAKQFEDDVKKAQKALADFNRDGTTSNENILKLKATLASLGFDEVALKAAQAQAKIDQFSNSIPGLIERLNALRKGSAAEVNKVLEGGEKGFLREQTAAAEQIILLQQRLAQDTTAYDNDRIRAAQLQDIVDLREREVEAIISINRSQLELAASTEFSANQIRARVLEHLASQKTLNEALGDGLISAFDKAANFLDKRLGKLGDIPIVGDLLKFGNQQFLSKITTGLLDTFLPPELSAQFKKTGNPTVDALNKSNDYLKSIDNSLKTGGAATINIAGGAGGGGSSAIGALMNILTGGRNDQGPGGTPNFNPNFQVGGGSYVNGNAPAFGTHSFGGSRGGIIPLDVLYGGGSDAGNSTAAALGGRGNLASRLKQAITGKGGIFGAEGFGLNQGTFSTVGSGLTAIGSLFGKGRVGRAIGNTLTGAGLGLSLGTTIGSLFGPAGAIVGAGLGLVTGAIGGLLSGIFGNPQRKKDEQARSQYRDEAVAALTRLIAAAKSGDTNAVAQGAEVRSRYIEAASALKDKKTRNIALNELNEPNILWRKFKELQEAGAAAGSINERRRRIVPEFAEGNYFGGTDNQMADMAKALDTRRGYIQGGRLGVDRHLGLFADGEMILNQRHQRNIIEAAGFNVLAFSGVPNYPKPKPFGRYADGARFGAVQTSIAPRQTEAAGNGFALELHNCTFGPDAAAYLRTPDGKRQVIAINKEARANREI